MLPVACVEAAPGDAAPTDFFPGLGACGEDAAGLGLGAWATPYLRSPPDAPPLALAALWEVGEGGEASLRVALLLFGGRAPAGGAPALGAALLDALSAVGGAAVLGLAVDAENVTLSVVDSAGAPADGLAFAATLRAESAAPLAAAALLFVAAEASGPLLPLAGPFAPLLRGALFAQLSMALHAVGVDAAVANVRVVPPRRNTVAGEDAGAAPAGAAASAAAAYGGAAAAIIITTTVAAAAWFARRARRLRARARVHAAPAAAVAPALSSLEGLRTGRLALASASSGSGLRRRAVAASALEMAVGSAVAGGATGATAVRKPSDAFADAHN